MRRSLSLLLVLSIAAVVPGAAQSRNWKEALERDLETVVYKTTSLARFDPNRITHEGTALVVKRSGILASPARYMGAATTKVRDGQIIQPGGASAFFSQSETKQFQTYEPVYLVDVSVKDDAVVLEVIGQAIEPLYDKGRTIQTRYKGEIEFEFPAGQLARASAAELKPTFDAVLSSAETR